MLELFNTQIESLSIHQIGNMQKGEPIFLSQQAYLLNDQITSILKEYFLKPFRDKEENYMHFVNETSLEFNEMFGIAYAACPHAGVKVNRIEGQEIICDSHGARFSTDNGAVLKGPTKKSLTFCICLCTDLKSFPYAYMLTK